jgi:hypothetical protein
MIYLIADLPKYPLKMTVRTYALAISQGSILYFYEIMTAFSTFKKIKFNSADTFLIVC